MACAGCRHGQRHHLPVIQVCENAKKEGAESTPSYGEPGGIRTHDLLIRSQTLYPAELGAHLLFFAAHSSGLYILTWIPKKCKPFFEKI